jgi:predicted nucleic acid-binding Zn ribbon protein
VKIKICIVCKSELPSRRTRFCSGTCSEFHDSFKRKRKSLRLSSLLTPRKCIGCSNMFQPKTDRHACCSKVCWDILTADRQKKRRAEKREELARKNPKGLGSTAGSGNRSRKIGTFGQPTAVNIPKTFVATAAFTNADTEERVELQSQVEEFLANGGKIMRYGAQPAITDADSITKWEISDEEQDVEIERYKGTNALNGN